MGDQIELAARAVLAHPWASGPWTAHAEHKFDAECAVCQGDVRAILTVAAVAGADVQPATPAPAGEPADRTSEHADLRRRYADALSRSLTPQRGLADHLDAVLAVRDDELAAAQRLLEIARREPHEEREAHGVDVIRAVQAEAEHDRLQEAIARVRSLRDYLVTATGDTETGALLLKVAHNLSDILNGAGAVSEKWPSVFATGGIVTPPVFGEDGPPAHPAPLTVRLQAALARVRSLAARLGRTDPGLQAEILTALDGPGVTTTEERTGGGNG